MSAYPCIICANEELKINTHSCQHKYSFEKNAKNCFCMLERSVFEIFYRAISGIRKNSGFSMLYSSLSESFEKTSSKFLANVSIDSQLLKCANESKAENHTISLQNKFFFCVVVFFSISLMILCEKFVEGIYLLWNWISFSLFIFFRNIILLNFSSRFNYG